MHQPFPRGLGDLVCLEKILTADIQRLRLEGSELDRRMDIIMSKYDEVNLPTNPKKAFDNALLSSFWGAEIDGSKGLMSCNSVTRAGSGLWC